MGGVDLFEACGSVMLGSTGGARGGWFSLSDGLTGSRLCTSVDVSIGDKIHAS